jgi:hypothetical protein
LGRVASSGARAVLDISTDFAYEDSRMPDLRTRPEIHSPEAAQILTRLRQAFQALKDKQGPGGYQQLAGIHGLPDFQCLHHVPGWLPWHRLYVLQLEDALRSIDADLVLPFWDWTSAQSVEEGLPAAFTDPTYQPAGGPALPNPLLSGTYMEDQQPQETFRNVGTRSQRQQTADEVAAALNSQVFADFSEALAVPHDDLHSVWVQGSMGDPTYAAYDPIFWAHHANVDRLWAQWQLGPNNDDPDASTQAQMLTPFNQSVAQTIKFREDLHYTYAGLTTMSPLVPESTEVVARPGADGSFTVRGLRFNALRQRVSLVLQGVSTHGGSFRLDVFVNPPGADRAPPIEGNVHFAGSIGIFGMSMPPHGGSSPPAPGHPVPVLYERRLDITHTVAVFAKDDPDFKVKLVARDARGNLVEVSKIPVKRVVVRVE